jgi:hypothetical protein
VNTSTSSIHYHPRHQAQVSKKAAFLLCACVVAAAIVMIVFVR